jgi:hypothetical protein
MVKTRPQSKYRSDKPSTDIGQLDYPFEMKTGGWGSPERVIGVINSFEEGEALVAAEWNHRRQDKANKLTLDMFNSFTAPTKLREAFKYMANVAADARAAENAEEAREELKAKREDGRHKRKQDRLARERAEWGAAKIAEAEQLLEDFAELVDKASALRALDDAMEPTLSQAAYATMARIARETKEIGEQARVLSEAFRAHHFAVTHSRHFTATTSG